MDTVKQCRTKVEEGDFMSVPNNYFGNDYLAALQTIGVVEDCLYGMVVQHINGTQLFVEGNETKTSLDKVTINEPIVTPIQRHILQIFKSHQQESSDPPNK